MYCTNCGNKLNQDDNYCTMCGNEIKRNDVNNGETNQSFSNRSTDNKGNISFVFGILSCIFFWIPILSIPFMITSFIWGKQYKKETGMKSVGIILSIISFILMIIELIAIIGGIFLFIFNLTDIDNLHHLNWDNFEDYIEQFPDNKKEEKDSFDINGYSWKGDDNSILYLNPDESYVWYQDDSNHQNNFYLGIYETYNGNDAIQYIIQHLSEYGLTEQEQRSFFQDKNYDLEDYYLIILNCTKTVVNGQEQESSDGSKLYYYGFYEEETRRLDLVNMKTRNKAGFTLKDKLSNIDI